MYIRKDTISIQPIIIEAIEKRYGGTFIGDFCLKNKYGSWDESPIAIFYQPNPNTELGHSHYFGIFVRNNEIYITNGESAFSEPITGIVADNGEIIYSRYRHDMTSSTDKSVWVDGGRDYTRSGVYSPDRYVRLVIDKDQLVVQINKEE